MGMSSHQSAKAKSVDWLTPPEWIKALGPFDLDPCCPPDMPWTTAKTMWSELGFARPWHGRVWLNPPFGSFARQWLAKMRNYGNGIALIPARTETEMFYESVWGHANAICFVRTRPHFHVARDTYFKVPGGRLVLVPAGGRAPFNSGAPISLIAYGAGNVESLKSAHLGVVLEIGTLHHSVEAE